MAGVTASKFQPIANGEEDIAIPESPFDEALSLLTDMLEACLFESYTNSFYGLDSYLSLRARHGSLSGQLRAPLEEERLITQREEGTSSYHTNRFWIDKMSDLWVSERLDTTLAEFSREFDVMIQAFADEQLQIAVPNKPSGLFSFRITEIDLLSVQADVRTDSAFSTFVDRCIDVFWADLGECLDVVREYIGVTLRGQVMMATSALIGKLEALRDLDNALDELISAIRRAQSRMHHSLISLQGWFVLPKSVSGRSFSIDEMVDISLQQVKKLHPNFSPILQKQGNLSTILLGGRIPDLLFILFENVQKHSGMDYPRIDLTVVQKQDRVTFQMSSDYLHPDGLEERLSRLRGIIESGKYQHIVGSEGGTGLVKLWNIIKSEFSAPSQSNTLTFGDVDGRFRVEVSFPYRVIIKEGG
jgi:hypothetical protein